MLITPRRHEYKAGEYFVPENDLYVYISGDGIMEPVPVNKVSIAIVTNPDSATPNA